MFTRDPAKYKEIEHTADTGIEVLGSTLDELFANAVFGMYDVLYANLQVPEHHTKSIGIEEPALTELFVAWLSEINYLLMVGNFVAARIINLQITTGADMYALKATLSGDFSNKYESRLETEIKAVTYHGLVLENKRDNYRARVIFDL